MQLTDNQLLCRAFSQSLGITLSLAVSERPIQEGLLGNKGRQILQGFRYAKRRHDWLCGRNALLQVMRSVGDYSDPADLGFPHPRFSLTHSKGKAIAVADKGKLLTGIGIDYETARKIKPGMERFYLSESEQQEIMANGYENDRLLSLWTIKEALYKADPSNSGRVLKDYLLLNPFAMEGEASTEDGIFQYCCLPVDTGFVSVAIGRNPDNQTV